MAWWGQLRIGARQAVLAVISLLVVCACVGVGIGVTRQLTASSQVAFVAKDVVADILPPPMYLIEMRLVLSQSLEGNMDAHMAKKEVERLSAEYADRVKHWRANPPFGLESDLLGRQHTEGERFIAGAQQLVTALAAGQTAQARGQLAALDAVYQAHRQGVDTTVRAGSRLAEASMADFDDTASLATRSLAAILALGLAVLGTLSWLVARSIVQPVQQALAMARAVAAGDLGCKVPVRGGDEIAQLLAALNSMSDSLAAVVNEVRSSSLQVASAGSQLAGGNQSLQQRTEAHRKELLATSMTLKEVTAFVHQNGQAAENAKQLAGSTTQTAGEGMAAVADVNATMQGIIRSSSQVADIVGLIETVAFQTNLLALNAAVEAARAGEQGKGFAVVAGEVRQLAGRASHAAREIRQLVQASHAEVEAGSRLTAGATTAIEGMVTRVQEVSALVHGIWETSFAQSSGISMLGETVATLAEDAQQNATLVNDTAQMVHNLADNAQALQQAVAFFRLPSDGPQRLAPDQPVATIL